MKKLLLILSLFTVTVFNLQAQTVLAPGDIMILEINADFDEFTFVTLVDLAPGTVIHFTDCGTAHNGTFGASGCNEGGVVFTVAAAISAGQTFSWIEAGGSASQFTNATADAVLNTGQDPNLAGAGDQILVFQDADGDNVNPYANPTFIFALTTATTDWSSVNVQDPIDSNQSGLPAGLTDGTTALALGSGAGNQDEFDNLIFNSAGAPYASPAAAAAAILNPANWVQSNIIDAAYTTAKSALLAQVLPVEIIKFTADVKASSVELNWETASERNNAYFAVEKSLDGRRFSEMTKIEGAGTSDIINYYSHTDNDPTPGIAYYRLKPVDFDGAYDYSSVLAVAFGGNRPVEVYPNPATQELNIRVSADDASQNEPTIIEFYNVTRQLVKSVDLGDGFSGTANFTINELAAGTYTVVITTGTKETIRRVVVSK